MVGVDRNPDWLVDTNATSASPKRQRRATGCASAGVRRPDQGAHHRWFQLFRELDNSMLCRIGSRAGLVTLRQTFVRRCHADKLIG